MMNEPGSRLDNPRRDLPDDSEERWAAAHRHHRFLAGLCILLAAAVVGLAWYAYPMMKRDNASLLNRLPSLSQSVDSIGDRLREAEAKAADSSNAQQSLREQVTDLSRNLRARIEGVSKQAGQSAEEAYHKLQARIEMEMQAQTERLAKVNERVSSLESSRDGNQVQLAQLKQDLNQVREQTQQLAAQQSGELAQIRRQMDENQSGEGQQLAEIKRGMDTDRKDIDNVSDRIAVQKIAFEAPKDHNRDLTDGITLHIESTDPAYRRVSGWMWVESDHRSIWLRNQSAQQPVIFYGNKDGQKRELVITNVAKNSVTGYLLLPKQAGQTAGAAAAGGSTGQ
jgi:hypothetical protein